jgi:tagatose 6-phosphate kinase
MTMGRIEMRNVKKLNASSAILCVGCTPAMQRVMIFRELKLDAVNRAVTTLDGAAGKSINVAKVLKALGAKPIALGFLGGDRGRYLRSVLDDRGIGHTFVEVAARTRQCVTVIDESSRGVTELVEESQPVAAADYDVLLATLRKRIKSCRALVMSGTLTPGGPVDFYFHCTRLARAVGAFSIVDAQGAALIEALKAGPGLVKPNRLELAATVGRALPDERARMSAISELHERGAQRVVVTAGKEPTLAFDGRRFWRVRAPRIAAVNPIGSGDAFTAALMWRLLRGEDLGEACRWGSAAGAANALTTLAGEISLKEVKRLARKVVVERVN